MRCDGQTCDCASKVGWTLRREKCCKAVRCSCVRPVNAFTVTASLAVTVPSLRAPPKHLEKHSLVRCVWPDSIRCRLRTIMPTGSFIQNRNFGSIDVGQVTATASSSSHNIILMLATSTAGGSAEIIREAESGVRCVCRAMSPTAGPVHTVPAAVHFRVIPGCMLPCASLFLFSR